LDKVIIIDADMASAFAKIKRLELLKGLFSKHRIVITPEIYEELTTSLEYGYTFPLLVTYKEAEPFTTKVKQMDFSKAVRDLKHDPQVTPEDGIRRTVEWMRNKYNTEV